jgi:preprotein translocase SecE subunit
MAVAVKTTQETVPQQRNRLAVGSLFGTIYVLIALGMLRVFPVVWQTVAARLLPSTAVNSFVNLALLGLAMLAVLVGLIFLGLALVGRNPPRGLRAGIFVGVLGALVLSLIASGIGMQIERAFPDLSTPVGLLITGGITLLLFVVGSLAYFRTGFNRWLVTLEEQGWFSVAAYKRTQGQRVRRGTILGILILAGSGVYTLLNHNLLHANANWGVALPFVYSVRLDSLNAINNPIDKQALAAELQRFGGSEAEAAGKADQLPATIGEYLLADLQRRGWDEDEAKYKLNHLPTTIGEYLGQTEKHWLVALLLAAGGSVFIEHQVLVLLPQLPFTVPLLLAALALWFAYRVVNLPTFADFLIATEAELNKVSWTTRKRLVQDTIVVLTTMLLLTAFLFAMDSLWINVLSWRWINVLQAPSAASEKQAGPQDW